MNAGPLERKREQVLKNIDKRAFLDVLMGESQSISIDKSIECQEEEKRDDKENVSLLSLSIMSYYIIILKIHI